MSLYRKAVSGMNAPHSRLVLSCADLFEAIDYLRACLNPASMAYPIEVQRALKVAAIVTYCKPFTSNRGEGGKRGERLAIQDYLEPGAFVALHDQAMTLRDQLLAHADWNARPNSVGLSESGHPMQTFTLFDVLDDPLDLNGLLRMAENILQKVDQARHTYMASLSPQP